MSFNYFIHVLIKRRRWLIILPIITALLVFYISHKKKNTYSSRMSLYTGLSSGLSVESIDNSKVDYAQASMAYENLIYILKSDKTLEDVGLRLFANVLVHGDNKEEFITHQRYQEFIPLVPASVKQLVVKESIEETLDNLRGFMKKDDKNFIYGLINKSSTEFSKGALSSFDVKRVKNTDIVEISFTTDDPALCYQSLKALYEETKSNYKTVKLSQSSDVVDYFEEQLDSSTTKLNRQENDYVSYNQDNKIINFPEQTKQVVAQKLDLEQQLDRLAMTSQGASQVIAQMEAKMGLQNRLRLKSSQVLFFKEQIGRLAAENAMQASLLLDSVKVSVLNRSYDRRLNGLKREFAAVLDTISLTKYTADGISMEQILGRWLENVVTLEQSRAQIPVLEKRAQEVDGMFGIYAPMGAMVKRKERAIDVTERQYLSLLNSLSSAKMKEQNDEITANAIRMLDEPSYPFSALPDKSKMLAVLAALASFILVLAFIIITEYFDITISTVERAERHIKVKIDLLFPLFYRMKKENVDLIKDSAARLLTLEILRQVKSPLPITINLFAIYHGEGVSYLHEIISNELLELSRISGDMRLKDIKIIENPVLKENYISPEQIKAGDLNILVCRANRAWRNDDKNILNNFSQQANVTPLILLNGVSFTVFESKFGELPFKRSKLHKLVKRLINLEFGSKEKL